ncbi:MAG: heat shock protein HspQ [Candidatus Lindowbacteria bacterium]|nr:heat shock protein HspQ [Candidatus Lindowbacteria bacterium]
MNQPSPKYYVGQLVHHKLFDYRGVIYDVDPYFQGTDKWYDSMAKSKPPKDKPWYHVLVNNAVHTTYVSEQNLIPDDSKQPIDHPMIDTHFDKFGEGKYSATHRLN